MTEQVQSVAALQDRLARTQAALRAVLYAHRGFADAVRMDTGRAYPWAPMDLAEETAAAALGDDAP